MPFLIIGFAIIVFNVIGHLNMGMVVVAGVSLLIAYKIIRKFREYDYTKSDNVSQFPWQLCIFLSVVVYVILTNLSAGTVVLGYIGILVYYVIRGFNKFYDDMKKR